MRAKWAALILPSLRAQEAPQYTVEEYKAYQDVTAETDAAKKTGLIVKFMQDYAKSKAPDAEQAKQRLPVAELEARNSLTTTGAPPCPRRTTASRHVNPRMNVTTETGILCKLHIIRPHSNIENMAKARKQLAPHPPGDSRRLLHPAAIRHTRRSSFII